MRYTKPAYYLGCWDGPGHYLIREGGAWVHYQERPTTLRDLDCGYAPKDENQPQGAANLVHEAGQTILAFWDRTGDKRFGSNSAFLLPGTLDFDEAVAAARRAFPRIWARLDAAGVAVVPYV